MPVTRGKVDKMIRCQMCGDLGDADEMYFVSLFPSFTYLDAVLCKTCIKQLQYLIEAGKTFEFDWEDWARERPGGLPECGFYWSGYDEILETIPTKGSDEIECPVCGGLAIWDVEDLGEENGEDVYGEVIWKCLNCPWWRYVI
jgi:hypothetical protein